MIVPYFIKHKLSPEIICGRLELISKGEVKISYETIYQWILTERPDLYEYLIKAGKPRRRRVPGKRKRSFKQPAAPKTSIELRPQEVEQRERLGDLEHDSMVSRKSNVAIQNIVDRASRKVFLQKLEDQSANTYSNALITRMKEEFPLGILKTATSDNGKENANHHIIDSTLKINSFFAHPYCSSERGTVENRNGIARWLGLPKGCDFNLISLEQLKTIEDQINRRPLKCLQFKTPNEKFKELLALELQAQTLSA